MGSSRTVRVDVRVIAATNRVLDEAVRGGRFRADLFYRLHVFPIQVPPLRARPSDIPQFVMFFLTRFARKLGKQIDTAPQSVMDLLSTYAWPGNIHVEPVEAALIEEHPSASIVTTLYDLIAAIQSIVDADDTLAVATVCRILASGRPTWCGDVAQCPSLPVVTGTP